MNALTLTAWVALLCSQAFAFPDGAPGDACEDMIPQHSPFEPQESEAPYTVSYVANDGDYTVTISGNDGETFRGFFIQAQAAGDSSPLGLFTITDDGNSQIRECPEGAATENGATHTINDDKTSVSVNWEPDGADLSADLRFMVTVVQQYDIFWVGIESDTIM